MEGKQGQEAAACRVRRERNRTPAGIKGPRLANTDAKAQSIYVISDARNCVCWAVAHISNVWGRSDFCLDVAWLDLTFPRVKVHET